MGELGGHRKFGIYVWQVGCRFLFFSKSVSSFDLPLFFDDIILEKIFLEHITFGNDRPSLENERRVAPDMMENISRENDDFRPENISSQDVPYAFRSTQSRLNANLTYTNLEQHRSA